MNDEIPFLELLEMLRSGADNVPPSIYDDLSGIYQSSVDQFASASAAVDEKIARVAALENEIMQMKAKNYELFMRIDQQPDVETIVDTESNHEDSGIEGLFDDEDKDEN